MSKFRGVGTALVTPFKESGALDEAALESFVDFQIEGGVNFLVPCGTTGENPTLSGEETRRVIEIVVKRAKKQSRCWPGGLEFHRQGPSAGAAGHRPRRRWRLTITPFYTNPTPDGLRRISGCRPGVEMKKASPDGHVQRSRRTGVNMTAATTLQIAREVPNVIGVKEASGNMEQILEIVRDRPKNFLVLSGDDAWALPLLAVGADGVISVASNEVPALMRELVDKRSVAVHNDCAAASRQLHRIASHPREASLKMMGILNRIPFDRPWRR